MIVYLVVRLHPGSLTDYNILSTHDSLSLATAALSALTDGGNVPGHLRYAIVGPLPRDKS